MSPITAFTRTFLDIIILCSLNKPSETSDRTDFFLKWSNKIRSTHFLGYPNFSMCLTFANTTSDSVSFLILLQCKQFMRTSSSIACDNGAAKKISCIIFWFNRMEIIPYVDVYYMPLKVSSFFGSKIRAIALLLRILIKLFFVPNNITTASLANWE